MVWSPVKEFPIKVWNTYCRGSKKVTFGPNWTKFGPKWQKSFFSPRMAKEASFPHVLKPWVIVFHKLLKFFTKEDQKMSILAKIAPNLALKNQSHFYCHQKYRFQICPTGVVKIWIQSEPTTISAPYLLFAYIPGGLKVSHYYSSAP